MQPCEDWFIAALCHARNPEVWCDEQQRLHVGTGGVARPLGRHAEGRRFHFRLSCGEHLHYCTPHAVTGPDKLLCRACEPSARLAAACVRPFTVPEHDMHQQLASLGLGTVFVAQAKLPWWHGQLDFWDNTAGLAVQVDGPRHFMCASTRVPLPEQQRTIDAAMLAAAWGAGAALVRVRDYEVGSAAVGAALVRALQARSAAPAEPILVLTTGFQPSPYAAKIGERDRWAFLCDVLDRMHTHTLTPQTEVDCFGNLVFTPRPRLVPTL